MKSELYATQEYIPSVSLFLSKLLVMKKAGLLEKEEEMEPIFKLLISELDRRGLNKLTNRMNNSEVAKYIYPTLEQDIHLILESHFHNSIQMNKKREEKEEEKMEVDHPKSETENLCFCKSEECEQQKLKEKGSICPNL